MQSEIRLAVMAFCLLWIRGAVAADWPQWRGPDRNGISKETGLLQSWPAEGPKLAWKADDLGAGYSTPAIVGDRIYEIGNKGLEDEFVEARSVKDGSQIWSVHAGAVGNPKQQPAYPGARSTPTVDGESLYALGSDGDLVCLETKSGDVRWKKNLRSDFGGQPGTWAYSESPLIDGDVLVCTPGAATASIVALNKTTGDEIWRSPIESGGQAAYSSAIVVGSAVGNQYVQFLQKGLVGVDTKTGKLLWRYDKTAQGSPANIPTPVAADDLIYSATGMSGGGLVKLKSDADAIVAEQIYFAADLPKAIGGAVKINDYLYGTTNQVLQCVEFATGKKTWSERSIGPAAICYADGCLYLHGENGDLALVAANSEKYEERGRFTPTDQPDRGPGKAWTYPAIANGRLYIRDQNVLWCYDVSAGK
jgi:outer membrane protein assembly factor BamB